MPFRLLPKSTTLDDLERPYRTLLHNDAYFGAHRGNLKKDRRMLSAAKM